MPYKNKEQAKEASKERMRKHRQGVTSGVTRMFTPSKFIAEEEDLKMQERVKERIKTMSGAELVSFGNLFNGFTPNQAQTR